MPQRGGSVTMPGPVVPDGADAGGWSASGPLSVDFAERFPQLYRRAYAVAYRILGEQAQAQDVAQETLARLYLRWSKLAGHALPWVVTVAVNLALDQHRTRQRDHRRHRELVALRGNSPAGFGVDSASDHRADLVRALRTLPPRQRQVVVLRYLGDISEVDTASQLGISAGSVKAHASRGLAALRAILQVPDQE
jgi:RNA polymerase sigma-70 factor (sigma-E family)